jgi:hypothetical protein
MSSSPAIHALLFVLLGLTGLAVAAPTASWRLTEHLGYTWTHELITYPLPAGLDLAPGEEKEYILRDDTGTALPFQVLDQHGARVVALLVDLPPYATRTFTLTRERATVTAPVLTVTRDGDSLLLDTGATAVRVAGPSRVKPGTPFAQCPVPIQAVRGVSGAWLGAGTLLGEQPVIAYTSEIEARGPLVAQVRVRYDFGPRQCYQVRIRVIAGEPVVLVEEEFALSADELAAMRFVQPPNLAPEIGTPSNYSDWLVNKGIGWNDISTDLTHCPCFRFNFTQGMDVPRVRGYGVGQAKAVYTRKDLASAEKDWRLGFVLTPYQERGRRGGAIGFESTTGKDYLGLFYRFGSRWVHPNENRVLLPWLDEGVVGHFAAGEGRREWGLYLGETGPQNDEYAQKGNERSYAALQRICAKYGETPLDKVKEWALAWDLPADAVYPRIFYTPASLARMKKEFPGLPGDVKKLLQGDRHAYAYLTGNDAELKTAFANNTAGLRLSAVDFLNGGHNTYNTYTHRYQEICRSYGRALDITLTAPGITPEERQHALAVVAFLAYKLQDQDYWPYRAYGGGPSNPNMMSISCNALATLAALLPDHPAQRDWFALCRRLVSADIMNSISPAGAWLESPGYQGAGNTPINETVLILKNAGVVNLADDPVYGQRLQAVSTYFANLLTPPDLRFQGRRMPMALGDNTPFWNNHYTYIADSGKARFPTDTGHALWCWQQMGRPIGEVGLLLFQEHVLDGTLPAVPIDGKSISMPGFGVMLRHGFGTPAETFLTYRQNDFGYGHYDEDQGSFSLFAKCAPLCLDWIDYSPNEAEYHNRVVYSSTVPWLAPPPDATALQPEADYVRSHEAEHLADPAQWQRQLLLVKDTRNPADATYLMLRDQVTTGNPCTWNLWTLAKKGSERIDGNIVRLEGQYGVDLLLVFTRRLEVPLASTFYHHQTKSYITMDQDQTRIQARGTKGGDFGAVLLPLRHGIDPEPTVRELPSGAVEIAWGPTRRHLVFLFSDERAVTEGNITFRGRAGVVKIEDGRTVLVPLECSELIMK